MPLLCSYNGSTSVIVPKPLRGWVWRTSYPSGPTALGKLLGYLVTVDSQAKGKIIELGWLFMLYMALLAVWRAGGRAGKEGDGGEATNRS